MFKDQIAELLEKELQATTNLKKMEENIKQIRGEIRDLKQARISLEKLQKKYDKEEINETDSIPV